MTNNMKTLKLKSPPNKINYQEGIALLISVVVLLVLTIVALAATDSNQLQSLMVRNAQFRMEAFNASYTEIDAQIDSINSSNDQPAYLQAVIDGRISRVVASSDGSSPITLPRLAPAEASYMTQTVEQRYLVQCDVFGDQLGAGQGNIQCAGITINSDSQFTDRTSIESNQRQVFNYKYLSD